ncbi:MAG: hydroxymethylglutaryl-CoA lyase [Chloroflexi bacterium]|nr:MAG: hydroxymethylglutaryl-CoA lyase [Chloroflexota bacterium]
MAGWGDTLPQSVEIVEVGPRDGFQILPDWIETSDKVRIINSLIGAGIRRMEVTSFVHPRAVPQMRDAMEVVQGIDRDRCACFAMVPNLKGAERAIEAGIGMLNLIVSASESHNQSNVRMSIEESLAGFGPVLAVAREAGVPVRASMSTVFGCPFEGHVPVARVLEIGRRLLDMGCVELNLCDTTGMANPRQVAHLACKARKALGAQCIVMHFHNTRGIGAANLLAALQAGINRFEASFGGLGGCPFAPGAAGNVATEDMVHMLSEMEIYTGVDLPALLDAVRQAEKTLNMVFPGQVIKAGRSCDLHVRPTT